MCLVESSCESKVKVELSEKELKPWLIAEPEDPKPEQQWYVSARYFARQLIKDNLTLLTKRDLLASKVAHSLSKAGIKKRGGKKPFEGATIIKAFSNVSYYERYAVREANKPLASIAARQESSSPQKR